MKNNVNGLMIVVLLLVGVGMAQAQMDNDVLKVTVPFFQCRGETFPAGEYSLKPLVPHTLLLRNEAGQTLTNIGTHSVESREVQQAAELVFNGHGGRYFLARIWNANDNIGGELAKSRTEVELANKFGPGEQIALRVARR